MVTLWLSVIVLLPLAALTVAAFDEGLSGFWQAITSPAALAALAVTVAVSAVVALVNAVLGTLVAWVLVRDEFRGKRIVNALIDLPFALPTIVASIVLLSLYGPHSPIGVQLNATRWGLVVALLFGTLPFVVRSVQPVLIETDREVEEAAASLGATAGPRSAGSCCRRWVRRSSAAPASRSRVPSGSTDPSSSSAATSPARRRWPRSTSSSRSRSTARRRSCCRVGGPAGHRLRDPARAAGPVEPDPAT